MDLFRPSIEIWEQKYENVDIMSSIWAHIAKCVRVCYQSETRKNPNETDEDFVKRTILRHEPKNSEKNHLAMLEHGTVYLDLPNSARDFSAISDYAINKYTKLVIFKSDRVHNYITTNLRVIYENNWLDDLQYICAPTEYHAKRITVCFQTNIGVSREFNRHRVNSIAEESTRYCNYTKDRFGGSVKFTLPTWLLDEEHLPYIESHQFDHLSTYCEEYLNDNADINPECWCDMDFYLFALTVAEYCYEMLIKKGWTAQQAREVLPLATKTQLVHTAYIDDWKHFINLRYKGISGPPHPNAKYIAKILYNKLVKLNLIEP
jgi:thymidylate synthase (FAD)